MSEQVLDLFALMVANVICVCCAIYSFVKAQRSVGAKLSRLIILFLAVIIVEIAIIFAVMFYVGSSFSDVASPDLVLYYLLVAFIMIMVSSFLAACNGSKLCLKFLIGQPKPQIIKNKNRPGQL